jgi:hypothetical protein
MADSLALAKRDLCNIAQVSNDSTALMIKDHTEVDSTELAVYLRTVIGQFRISQPLAVELCRRFENLDRKKQVNGTYLEIDGARSLNAWLEMHEKQIGSKRNFYYVRDGGKKPAPQLTGGADENGGTSGKKKDTAHATFVAHCGDAKKALAEIQRQTDAQLQRQIDTQTPVDFKSLEAQTNVAVYSVFYKFLSLISPEGCEVSQGDNGKFWVRRKREEDDEPEPPSPEDKKAKRSAAAKKAATTRAAKKAAALPPPTQTATTLGECESCCDGTPATEVVGVTKFNSDGQKVCAKCADDHRKYERKYLMRQMGVGKVMGEFHTLKTLAKLGGKPMDLGDGEVHTYPTVADYIARVKEEFLGNTRYDDQKVVVKHIARLEKRMETK